MELFDNAKYSNLFRPFCNKNKKVYYDCIKEILKLSNLYEGNYFEEEVKVCLQNYLTNTSLTLEDDEDFSFGSSSVDNASTIIRYFRSVGWLEEREVGRNGDNLVRVTYQTRKIIRAIDEIFDVDRKSVLPNLLINISAGLSKLATTTDADNPIREYPWMYCIDIAHKTYLTLRDEIDGVRDSIEYIRRFILSLDSLADLNKLALQDEATSNFFTNFGYVMQNGVFPKLTKEIYDYLRMIREDDALYDDIIKDCMRKENYTEETATIEVNGVFNAMMLYFDTGYDLQVSSISRQIQGYYSLWNARAKMVMEGGSNVVSLINKTLSLLKLDDDSVTDELSEKMSELFFMRTFKVVCPKSLIYREYRPRNTKTTPVTSLALTDEERNALINSDVQNFSQRFTVKAMSAFVKDIVGDNTDHELKSDDIKDMDDVYLLIASQLNEKDEEFPFFFTKSDGRTGASFPDGKSVDMSSLVIHKKEN